MRWGKYLLIFILLVVNGCALLKAPTSPPVNDKPVLPAKKCVTAGCSGQVCADETEAKDIMTTCEIQPWYQCFQLTECELQASGECGWTETNEYNSCVKENKPIRIYDVDELDIFYPTESSFISSPIKINGLAGSNWFDESKIKVVIFDSNNIQLGEGFLTISQGQAIENNAAPFEGQIEFADSSTATGTIVFYQAESAKTFSQEITLLKLLPENRTMPLD